jgi:hypothetical protein
LIDEIVFDPRINDLRFIAIKNYITSIGFNGRVVKSQLYKLPKLNWK